MTNLLPDSIKFCVVNTTNERDTKYYMNQTMNYSTDLTVLTEDEVRTIWQSEGFVSIFWVVLFSYDGVEWKLLRPTFMFYMFNKPYAGRSKQVAMARLKMEKEFAPFKARVTEKSNSFSIS